MSNIESRAKELIVTLFGKNAISINEILEAGYIEELFEVKAYIDDINSILNSSSIDVVFHYLNDEEFKDSLLTRKGKVNRVDEDKINVDFLNSLVSKIKHKKYDRNSIIMLLDLVRFMKLYSNSYSRDELKYILNNRIYSTIKIVDQVSDGDTILSNEEKIEKTKVLINWCKIFGNKMIDMVYSLDILLYRLMKLYSLDDEITKPYKNEIADLIAYTKLAIEVRDNNYKPNARNINNINDLFVNYKKLNNTLISNAISKGKLHLIHFVQSYDVDFELKGVTVENQIKTKDKETSFNQMQNNAFINDYLDHVIPMVERELGEPFNIFQKKHRNVLEGYIRIYNDTFNNSPLTRFPLNTREVYQLKDYYRKPNNRLSCSLTTDNNIKPHLDRKIGLVLSIVPSDIMTTSLGYTSCKDHLDFRNDYASYADIVESLLNFDAVNETVVDLSKVNVEKVIVLSNEPEVVERAQRIANNYNVELIRTFDVELPLVKEEHQKIAK